MVDSYTRTFLNHNWDTHVPTIRMEWASWGDDQQLNKKVDISNEDPQILTYIWRYFGVQWRSPKSCKLVEPLQDGAARAAPYSNNNENSGGFWGAWSALSSKSHKLEQGRIFNLLQDNPIRLHVCIYKIYIYIYIYINIIYIIFT